MVLCTLTNPKFIRTVNYQSAQEYLTEYALLKQLLGPGLSFLLLLSFLIC